MDTTTTATRRPVAPILKAMKIGEVVQFPLNQWNSVRTAPNNSLVCEMADGWRWQIEKDMVNKAVKVTRTA